eukprot:CAMPEP_0114151430 /NCGR_PEP_ID=MMETSP0043_2-20121206/23247_1 /TAXON_ID=464988 /ORGANISM="Hemiselmis andersenii, Strain CCMP644" /LENGTH=254 /DNA_ID=CAMNT_0001246257 /DNA_START=39 /DNA_END=799 /DNA_ORIENTATION=+
MISVPQLIVASVGASIVLGISSTYAASALYRAVSKRLKAHKVVQGGSGRAHYTLAPSAAVQKIAAAYKWYSPAFSPKNVPRFYDMASLTESPSTFKAVIDIYVERYSRRGGPTIIAGYDARGFALGAPIAVALGVPFVLLRKDCKSPGVLVESSGYEKEYAEAAEDKMCLRVGSIRRGDRVALVDDLIATGGTAIAGMQLVEELGAHVFEFTAVVSLPSLGGIDKIRGYKNGVFKDTAIFTLLDDATIGDANSG